MQTSIVLIGVLGSIALAAACGGRIETVGDETESSPTTAAVPEAPAAEAEPSPPPRQWSPSPDPPPGAPADCTTFSAVLATLAGLGCAQSACHGSANLPLIDPARPLETQRGFYGFVLSNGMRYVDYRSLDPDSSAIACNLRGTCGLAMPLGGPTPPASHIATIEEWLACGAP